MTAISRKLSKLLSADIVNEGEGLSDIICSVKWHSKTKFDMDTDTHLCTWWCFLIAKKNSIRVPSVGTAHLGQLQRALYLAKSHNAINSWANSHKTAAVINRLSLVE